MSKNTETNILELHFSKTVDVNDFERVMSGCNLNHNLAKIVMQEYYRISGFNYLENRLELDKFNKNELLEIFRNLVEITRLVVDYTQRFNKIIYRFDTVEEEREYLLNLQRHRTIWEPYNSLRKFDLRNLKIQSDLDILVSTITSGINGNSERVLFVIDAGCFNYIHFIDLSHKMTSWNSIFHEFSFISKIDTGGLFDSGWHIKIIYSNIYH